MGALTCWGNYTACYPINADVKDFFIPVSRMFGWVGSTVIKTHWGKLDKPMNRRLIESIMDTCNIWLNGLVGSGYLLGARVEAKENENPLTDLMAGIARVHIYIAPPPPLKETVFFLEYDVNYLAAALAG
jgi:phage tail sheath protein FI